MAVRESTSKLPEGEEDSKEVTYYAPSVSPFAKCVGSNLAGKGGKQLRPSWSELTGRLRNRESLGQVTGKSVGNFESL